MNLASVINPIGFYAIKAVIEWRQKKQGVDILAVPRSEAEGLTFRPAGHPLDAILYIGHPIKPATYYVASQFHRLTFEDKLSEATRLLYGLGATKIRVERMAGWSRDFATKLSVPLGTTGVQVGGDFEETQQTADRIYFEATLEGNDKPNVPQDLAWYPHEPTWQQLAEGRQYGLKEFSLAIQYEDDFGINAGLQATASQMGIEMGGEFQNHQSTAWRMFGTFK